MQLLRHGEGRVPMSQTNVIHSICCIRYANNAGCMDGGEAGPFFHLQFPQALSFSLKEVAICIWIPELCSVLHGSDTVLAQAY